LRCYDIGLLEEHPFGALPLSSSPQLLEVARVALSGDWRGSLIKRIEVDPSEERMGLERSEIEIRAVLSTTETVSRVQLQELVYDVDSVRLKVVWDDELALLDLRKDLVVDLAMERCLAHSHLVDHAAEGPQVHARTRDILVEHLG